MASKILQLGNKVLTEVSREIDKKSLLSRANQDLIDELLHICSKEKDGTAGLSAVQIGELKRIYVARRIDLPADSDNDPVWEVIINPKLKVIDEKPSLLWEGCLSIGTGDQRLFGPVERPRGVRVSYLDREGKKCELVGYDYLAHILQHEQDHLNGILFLKYIKNPKNVWTSKELDKYLENTGHYPPVAK